MTDTSRTARDSGPENPFQKYGSNVLETDIGTFFTSLSHDHVYWRDSPDQQLVELPASTGYRLIAAAGNPHPPENPGI